VFELLDLQVFSKLPGLVDDVLLRLYPHLLDDRVAHLVLHHGLVELQFFAQVLHQGGQFLAVLVLLLQV